MRNRVCSSRLIYETHFRSSFSVVITLFFPVFTLFTSFLNFNFLLYLFTFPFSAGTTFLSIRVQSLKAQQFQPAPKYRASYTNTVRCLTLHLLLRGILLRFYICCLKPALNISVQNNLIFSLLRIFHLRKLVHLHNKEVCNRICMIPWYYRRQH